MNNLKQRIIEPIRALVHEDLDPGAAKRHTDALVPLFASVTGISADEDMNNWRDINTQSGVAISPVQAAKCLQEMTRTQVLLKAVNQAIEEYSDKTPVINILYAGTGPYGLLLLPLLAIHHSVPFRCCLIDIHEQSTLAVKKVVRALGIAKNIVSVDQIDACQWQPESVSQFDIILCETMYSLLQREPQVFVYAHLQRFLKPEGCFIPEQVQLSASAETDAGEVALGVFFTLNQDTAKQIDSGGSDALFRGDILIPPQAKATARVRLDTTIEVYKDWLLKSGQTSLTTPVYLNQPYFQHEQKIHFCYQKGPCPKFQFDYPRFIPEPELPLVDDIGFTGIYALKRFWHKVQLEKTGQMDPLLRAEEWQRDVELVQLCGGNLQQWLSFLYSQSPPDFARFERWVDKQKRTKTVQEINQQMVTAASKVT